MAEKPYRVIQWATGQVGKVAIRHFLDNPAFLRSGKKVVTPLGPHYPTGKYVAQLERLDAAAREGGVSFHGSGIHPGFAGDLLPLIMMRLMSRVEHLAGCCG